MKKRHRISATSAATNLLFAKTMQYTIACHTLMLKDPYTARGIRRHVAGVVSTVCLGELESSEIEQNEQFLRKHSRKHYRSGEMQDIHVSSCSNVAALWAGYIKRGRARGVGMFY